MFSAREEKIDINRGELNGKEEEMIVKQRGSKLAMALFLGVFAASLLSFSAPSFAWDSNYSGIWQFSETSGSVAADFFGMNNATVVNAVWNATGYFGSGISCMNSSSVITTNITPSLTHAFTIEEWCFINNQTTSGCYVGTTGDSGADGNYVLGAGTEFGGCIGFTVDLGSGHSPSAKACRAQDKSPAILGVWHHIAGAVNSTHVSIYVDGILVNSTNDSTAATPTSKQLTFCGKDTYFNSISTIDEVRIGNTTVRDASYFASYWQFPYSYTITITSPSNTTYNYNQSLKLNYTILSSITTSTCKYSLDDAANVSLSGCGNATFNASDGWHKLYIYVNDTGNNNYSANVNFTIDMTPPILSAVSPTPVNQSIIRDYIFLNITSNKVLSNASVEWNGANITMTLYANKLGAYLNMTSLVNYNWTYRFYANDSANNLGHTGLFWTTINNVGLSITNVKDESTQDEIENYNISIFQNGGLVYNTSSSTTGINISPSVLPTGESVIRISSAGYYYREYIANS